MRRDEFLEKIWAPYPEAGPAWLDVAAYLAAPRKEAIVAGRWRGENGMGSLSSAGAQINVERLSSEKVAWLAPQKERKAFDPAWLSEGDLVCLRVADFSTESGSHSIRVSGVLLLAPSRETYEPRSRFSIEESKRWADFVGCVREFFRAKEFTEAFTPYLVPSPGTEPFLDPFTTEWHEGTSHRNLYLPTSPEFHLKKMLALGWTRVFEMKTCFRNGESGEHHQAEFWMLEWYRSYRVLDAIADDVDQLISHVARRFSVTVPAVQRVTMAELFASSFQGFTLRPNSTRDELAKLAWENAIAFDESDSWDDLFFRIFLLKIEPGLGANGPIIVRGYPPSQAALSRIGSDGFADRFEVYWKGLELANAFHELNDPDENAARFAEDARKKAELGKPAVPTDEELLRALRSGMPPSGGIALGLDRLYMALFNIRSIAHTRVFPM